MAKVTPLNLALMLVGLVILVIGLYRMVPVQFFSKRFMLQWAPVWLMFAFMAALIFQVRGQAGIDAGFRKTLRVSADFVPMIVGFFFTMGFGFELMDCFKSQIVGALSGNHGFFGALGAAFVAPSPTTVANQVKVLWEDKPAMRPQLVLFFISSPLLSITLLFIRQMGLEWALALKMYAVGFVLAVLSYPVLKIFGMLGLL